MGGLAESVHGIHRRRAAALLAGLILPLAVSAVLVPFRTDFANAAAALVLVAVVLAAAVFGDRWAGWVAALSSGVWFDFFLTRPYDTFSITRAHDIETEVALLVVGLAVTEIAVRGHRLYAVAQAEGEYLALLHDLSDLVATGAPAGSVVELAIADLCEVLLVEGCRFERRPSNAESPRLCRNGEVERGEVRYDVGRDGLPPGDTELPVVCAGRAYGVFVATSGEPGAAGGLSIERRVAALAIADQVGAALAVAAGAA